MSASFPLPPAPPLPRVRWRSGNASVSPEVQRNALMATLAPRVPFDRFMRDVFVWRPGEHVALIGPTGQGKTTLLLELIQRRAYVVVFATKPYDPSLDRLINRGAFVEMNRWRSVSAIDSPRRIIWPRHRRMDEAVELQRVTFADAFDKIYMERGWTIAIDETYWVVNRLGLGNKIRDILTQGRSLGISLVAATQRPKHVPLEIYDQSTHLFFWRDNDEENLRRLSGINVRSSDAVKQIIPNLEQYQVLYINTRTGDMARTRAPSPERQAA